MDVNDLIGKRFLGTIKERYGDPPVQELKVLEVSPSGQWVKVMKAATGSKFWLLVSSLSLVEVLKEVRSSPPPAP